jgi:vacuolar protein sorting-associated protein 13A/C
VGFFRGTAQGLVGIIVKPVTGVLDFAADTTEGIKNTALYFEDKPNENRMRCPRVFYGRNSELKEFIIIDAEINNLLQVMKEGRFASSYFLQAFMLESTSQLLAVLDNFLVVLSFKKREVEWYIPLRTVKNIRQEEEGLKLNLSQRCKYFPTDIATIQTAVP